MRRISQIFLLLCVCLPVLGQTFRGGINGTVSDASGAVVPHAEVKATNVATGAALTTTTTADGQFLFQDLPLGSYTVMVNAKGFPAYTAQAVPVTAGSIYTLPVKLKVASESTTVEVSAAALALDTTTQTQTTVIDEKQIQDIPLNGRDFTQLIAATPGFGGYSAGGFGSLNGTRANQMNWQIDGSDNNDLWHNIPAVNQGGVSGIAGIVLPIDAIDEFSAQTQSSAETGRNPGGTVNLVIKSGQNQIHGSAYYYNRNEAYAAASPFLPEGQRKPEMRNQQWGGSVGGPIIKDRTFYFLAFEKQKFTIGVQGLATEPSTAYQAAAQDLLTSYGVPASNVSTALLKNLWPSYALNGAATGNNYFSPDPEFGYSYNGIIKLDHNFNANNTLSARWFAGQGNQEAPVGSNLVWYYEIAPLHVQNYSIVFNSVLSPRISNQVLVGVNYFNQIFHDANHAFNVADYGLMLSPSATFTGSPNIDISGFDQIGLTPPEGRNDITGHITDAMSYTFGKHQFRFGGEFRQAQVNEFYYRHSLGSFSFDGSQGPWASSDADQNVKSLADFMAGYVKSSSISLGNQERQVFVNTFDLFFQDSFQLTRNLNLNYGLRYDYIGPLHNDTKDLSTFVPGKGLVVQGDGISSLYPADRNNFAPRVGFAYQPKGSSSVVLRGGVGMFYDTTNLNPFLDNRPGNGGPNGVESNPIGAAPVSIFNRNYYSWNSGAYLFPEAGSICPTGTGCGSNIYNVFSVSQHFRTPYYINYNLQVEKSLGNNVVAQVGYVGNTGHKNLSLLDINQPAPGVYTSDAALQAARPYYTQFPNFGVINQIESIGNANYNSLQTVLKVRNWKGFGGQFTYTWAHALDDMTQYRGQLPQDSRNFGAEWASSDFDTRHNFVAVLTYDVPGSSKMPLLTKGWQLNSLLSFHTGQPVTIYAASDTSGTNEGFLHADTVGDPNAAARKYANHDAVQWFNPDAFAQPADGAFGNTRRNSVYGPGYGAVDFSVIKNTNITERISTQFRIEMFNLFNRINLAPPDNYFGDSSFGQSHDTIGDYNGAPGIGPGEPFNMQLALKVIF